MYILDDQVFYRSYVLRHIRLRFFAVSMSIYYTYFGGRRSFIDPIYCLFSYGFAHVSKVGLALSGTRDMA